MVAARAKAAVWSSKAIRKPWRDAQRALGGTVATTTASTTAAAEESGRGRGSLGGFPHFSQRRTPSIAAGTLLTSSPCPSIGLLARGDEFRRITTDSPTGTRMDFSRAKTPPPSPLAVQVAEHYAMQPPGKRAELLARLAGFATKTHSAEEATRAEPDEGFLHLLGLE